MTNKSKVINGLLLTTGSFFSLIALAAQKVGLDHNANWGVRRLLLFGIGIILITVAYILSKNRLSEKYFLRSRNFSKSGRTYIETAICILVTAIIYIWFVSAGQMKQFPPSEALYDRLATAFSQGKLWISSNPDPRLLSLPDPYAPEPHLHLSNINDFFDLSLYQGKLYMYWGPTPALPIMIWKTIANHKIDDELLVLIFAIGLLVFQSLLIHYLWCRYFQHLPDWTAWMPILVGGLAEPILWMLSEPRIYEAAIMADQCFFIAGLYFVITATGRAEISKQSLFFAGICWVLAAGARAIIAIPIILLAFMIVFRILHSSNQSRISAETIKTIGALGIPLITGAVLLGWYNWARFASPFEFGFRYQITMVNLNKYSGYVFLPRYIIPNFYMYFLNPPIIRSVFPFIRANREQALNALYFQDYFPHIYNAERITGLIYTTPFAIFSLASVLFVIIRKRPSNLLNPADADYKWLLSGLLGSLALLIGYNLLFFYATTRYFLDVFPVLFLCTSIGFWHAYQLLHKSSWFQKIYAGLSIMLATTSIIAALLIAFSSNVPRFRNNNPIQYNAILYLTKTWIALLPR